MDYEKNEKEIVVDDQPIEVVEVEEVNDRHNPGMNTGVAMAIGGLLTVAAVVVVKKGAKVVVNAGKTIWGKIKDASAKTKKEVDPEIESDFSQYVEIVNVPDEDL